MGGRLFDDEIPFFHRLRTGAYAAVLVALMVLALIHLKDVIQPFIIAIFVFLLLSPGARWLKSKNVPTVLSYLIVIGAFLLVLSGTSTWLYADLSQMAEQLPTYTDRLNALLASVEGKQIFGYTVTMEGMSSQISADGVQDGLLAVFGNAASFFSGLVTVLVFLLFIILEAETLPERIAAAYPAQTGALSGMMKEIGQGVNRYVVVKTFVSFGTGFVTAGILMASGVPGWFLWGVLTFLLNYVPYIGSLIAIMPPSALALLTLDPVLAFTVIGLMAANQQLWGAFIETKMFGSSLDISPVMLLLITAFWFWLWGIIGMVLAVPMAVIAKIVLGNIDSTRPIAILLSERPPVEQSDSEE